MKPERSAEGEEVGAGLRVEQEEGSKALGSLLSLGGMWLS